MSIYYAFGNAIVTEEELHEKYPEESIPYTTGSQVELGSLPTSIGEVPFKEVGPGKPLTIEIRHLYTGKFPKDSFFDKTKDMLVTSAIKSLATFNAAPRAVNFIQKDIRKRHHLSNFAATEKGTPLIHYTPALTEKNTVLTIEIGFDEFPNEIFDIVGRALSQTAAIPLFVSANTYLLAAGAITKLIGNIGSRVFDRTPVFKATEPLTFLRPGDLPPQADFRLITQEDLDTSILKDFRITSKGLIDYSNNRYDGDIPYIIISLDGRKRDDYKDFTSTAASAALLEKFYNIRDGQEQALGPLLNALKLYNDWTFRKKADKLAKYLDNLDSESPEYKKIKDEYDALVANILDDLLKPKN